MNIIFFGTRLIYGGGEKVRNWLALELVNKGHKVIYVTSNYDEKYIKELRELFLYGKINILTYPYNNKYRNPFAYWKCIKSIYKENNIDLLIYFGGSLIEQIIARMMGVKILLSERCDPNSRKLLPRILKRLQYSISDGYVFQTPEAAKYYGNRAANKGIIIPNPIIDELPLPIFDNIRKEIVTVGRLSSEKNQKMLIKAFSEIVKHHPHYRLIIYGNGPLEESLKSYIELLGLKGLVDIIKGKRDIVNLINGSEIFVLPSNTEGMPNALIEAMSVGLLCISTDCPIYGPRMLIKHEHNGFLIPVDDVDKLKALLMDLITKTDETKQIRKNAVKIKDLLSPSIISQKWIDYIESL